LDGIWSLTRKVETFCMTTHYLLSVMASWWPFIMLIGAWIVVARFSRQRTASGATMIELQEQHVEETRRTNVLA
jgi:hypothetical protein